MHRRAESPPRRIYHWTLPDHSNSWAVLYCQPFRVTSEILACAPFYSAVGLGQPKWAGLVAPPHYRSYLDVAQAIYSERGVRGFYRGAGVAWVHGVFREQLLFELVRRYHRPVGRALAAAGVVSAEPSEGAVEHVSCGTREPTVDLAHLLLKCSATALSYPLQVLSTRLAVHRNAGPYPLGAVDMVRLSASFDGTLGGFFPGVGWQLLNEFVEGSVELVAFRVARRRRQPRETALVVAGHARMVAALVAGPLATLALIQRAQSRIPGLCDPEIGSRRVIRGSVSYSSAVLAVVLGCAAVLAAACHQSSRPAATTKKFAEL